MEAQKLVANIRNPHPEADNLDKGQIPEGKKVYNTYLLAMSPKRWQWSNRQDTWPKTNRLGYRKQKTADPIGTGRPGRGNRSQWRIV